ncbi:PREDICTED: uncharacterized protein LOC109229299 isoform X3 [Nicotiana attenuata]|uniref:uncharacterized protein LOC109229299 isoform X3 n=1 Tax=Nicotiana attenuata TaxID=49451 RepID=UPI0009051120|nr:PREDICTED: uncharacterized protein LOC109229299 isoform X3 [Nicotiana attenuata]
MSQTEEDKKPSGDQAAHINLKVKGQLGNELPPEKRESVENLTEKGASAGIPFSDDPFPLLFHLCLFFSQIRVMLGGRK